MNAQITADILRQSNLTKGQLLIWAGQQLDPETPLYNMALAFHFDGRIDKPRLELSIRNFVKRCDTLRTIVIEQDGVPVQQIRDEIPFLMRYEDFSTRDDPDSVARQWVQQRCLQPFQLDQCLFETALLKLHERRYLWYLNQHHLITDAWSFTLVYQHIKALYEQPDDSAKPYKLELPSHRAYRDFERASRENQEVIAYWQQQREHEIRPPSLYGRGGADSSTRSVRLTCDLGTERSARLRSMANQKDVRSLTRHLSHFNFFATTLLAYLYRVSGQRQLAIGAPAHNRPSLDFKQTIGLFMEVFPLSVEIEENESFLSLLRKVQVESQSFLRYARPGGSDADNHRSFNALLNYIHASFGDLAGIPMRSDWLHPGHSDRGHGLRLQVHDFDKNDRFLLHFDFHCEMFDARLRDEAIGHFLRLIDGLIADWQQPIQNVDLLSDRERQQIVVDLNATRTQSVGDQTVVDMFQRQVAISPEVTAIVCGDDRLTYRMLNERANQLAHLLIERGIGEGDIVGICLPRSVDLLIAILGVLKARAAYVPIDTFYPPARIALMLDDAHAGLVLTRAELATDLPDKTSAIFLDAQAYPIEPSSVGDPVATPSCKDVAYVIYTSGTTGKPKGVVVSHGALVHYVSWACRQYVGTERLSFPLFSPSSFDLTVTSIFVPLLSGGQIVVYPQTTDGADLALLDVIHENTVDIIKLTPSHLAMIQDCDLSESRVRQLIVGGEDLPSELARRMEQKFADRVTIYNEYGPTEATVGCIAHRFDASRDTGLSVPIGRPIDNMRAFVLNESLVPEPVGVSGELYLAGEGLADGYWERPELTAERFLPNPFDSGSKLYRTGDVARLNSAGTLEYLGRKDGQVKLRGVRIELGEVESALASHPEIKACVAVIREPKTTIGGPIAHCVRCGLPSNYPGAVFNEAGVCNLCTSFDTYESKTKKYFGSMDELRKILQGTTRQGEAEYDCLMLLSGGKDSTYALCQLVDMGLSVLAFSLDNGYISDGAKTNIRRVVETLGVDHEFGSTPAMNAIFADSLQRHANVCHGCFKTIYTLSMKLAREKQIPFVVTGLSRGQLFETRLTEELFTDSELDTSGIDRTILEARKAYHRVDDAVSRLLDVEMFQDERVFQEVRFIDFYRYSDVQLDEMLDYLKRRVPWIRPADTGRSTNCLINDVGIYVHQRVRHFHNYALPYSWDVRLGHKTRDEALAELDDEIDVEKTHRILREVGYEEPADTTVKHLVGYYTSDRELGASELKRYMAGHLPDFMLPSHFVRLRAIPLNSNGKLDRDALPDPEQARTAIRTPFHAPGTAEERLLSEIWSEVLRIKRIGVQDNFFDLGGDSIMAIQIISRANRSGLQLVPSQLFDYPTIRQLAAQPAQRAAIQAEQGNVVGPVELTPIQHWFFEQQHPQPDHWNQLVGLTVPEDIDPEILEQSFSKLLVHHDALRMEFTNENGQWRADHRSIVAPSLKVVDLRDADHVSRKQAIAEIEAELHRGIDLSSANLMKAALLLTPNRNSELLIAIHHLCVDAVSWPILIEDLASIYQQLHQGDTVSLPAKTISFQQWSRALHSAARQDIWKAELQYWCDLLKQPVGKIPVDPNKDELESQATAETVVVEFDRQETAALLQQVPVRYRIQVHELLTAAVALVLSEWTGERAVRLAMEGHGRDSLGEDIDTSRTVGWFTNIFPVTFLLPKDRSLDAVLGHVKDQLRSVPSHGMSFGVLRYLSTRDEVRRQLTENPPAQVLFNYLGRADQLVSRESPFQISRSLELSRDPAATRPYLLEIHALVKQDQLQVQWTFGRDRHGRSTIEGVANAFLSTLRQLIEHCLNTARREAASSDFPLADLDDSKLQKLSAALQNTDTARKKRK